MTRRAEIVDPGSTAVRKQLGEQVGNSCSKIMDANFGCCPKILRHHEEHGGLLMNRDPDKPNVEEKL